MKVLTFVGLFLSFSSCCLATLVHEDEPNNTPATANTIQCGDTVECAVLSPSNDLDHFRFYVYCGDSIIATSFDCNGSVTNTVMVLYDDHNTLLTYDDESGPLSFSQIRYQVSRSAYYVIRIVQLVSTPDSTYSLFVDCPTYNPLAYDLCTTPRIIPSLPYYDEGTTFGATSQCGTASPDVFYSFHNPITMTLYVTVCSDYFDSRVQIWGGCCVEPMDDEFLGCNRGAALISYGLAPGDYIIMVEGTAAGESGNYSIAVAAEEPPCPEPGPVTLSTIGGYPLLDWPELTGPAYYVVWQCYRMDGPFEHLGTTTATYFVDSSGYAGPRRFYYVTSYCGW